MSVTTIPSATTSGIPAMPTALVKKCNGPMLPTPTEDGTSIKFDAYNVYRYAMDGTSVWHIYKTDIDATCDYFTGAFWLDAVDSALWIWAYDTGASPNTYYLAKIALSTGVVTNVGTCQPGDGLFSLTTAYYYCERVSMGSGNLTIRDGDYKIVLSTIDGSIVTAATQVTQNSIAISGYTNYETDDGSIYVTYTISGTEPSVKIMRGGSWKKITLPNEFKTFNYYFPYLWNGYVALIYDTSSMPIFFSRVDFDAWLVDLCDYYGLPT